MISEKAIRLRHPDYNPDRAQKLIISSMSRHLSTRDISSKFMHAFLPCDAMHKRGLCRRAVSVCPSVRHVHGLSQNNNRIFTFFSPSGSPAILFFPHQTAWQYSNGNPPPLTGASNALLSGAPAATVDKLQRAQNNLARVVCQSRGRTDARPLLQSLHWLPVRQQVTYKLAVLTHKVPTTATPTYLSELVQTRAPPRVLRSSDAPVLVIPRVHTELARRAFSVAAPSTRNSLPAEIRLCENILTFKRHLKTNLFKLT